nr:stage V sporulation T C-terminal domain-containing protein [uncultured Sellimonas sp.]
MKATGIVRRIDDLGRVVIPKEIRRTLGIREGTPLEIYTGKDGEVILKKYSPLGELDVFAEQYVQCLAQTAGTLVCITDMEKVIAAAGNGKKEVEGQEASQALMDAMEERKPVIAAYGEKTYVEILKRKECSYPQEIIYPVLAGGDLIGTVIFLSAEKEQKEAREIKAKLAQCAAAFLGRQMESWS